jgi:hypothetical protein
LGNTVLLSIFGAPHKKKKRKYKKIKKKYWKKINKYTSKKNISEHSGNCWKIVEEDPNMQDWKI